MNGLTLQSKTIQVDVPSNSYENNSFTHISDLTQKEINFPNTGQDFGLTKETNTVQDEIPQQEIWKTHDEYPRYIFSSFGRVYSYRKSLRGNFISGAKTADGYIKLFLSDKNNENQQPYLSRVIYEIFGDKTDSISEKEVDHIRNKERTDNNINNLRLVDRKENCANKGKRQVNQQGNEPSSSYVGINWNKRDKIWQSNIYVGKTFSLGTYKHPINGTYVYHKVAKKFKPPRHWKNNLPNNFQLPDETENRDQVIVNKINEIQNWVNKIINNQVKINNLT